MELFTVARSCCRAEGLSLVCDSVGVVSKWIIPELGVPFLGVPLIYKGYSIFGPILGPFILGNYIIVAASGQELDAFLLSGSWDLDLGLLASIKRIWNGQVVCLETLRVEHCCVFFCHFVPMLGCCSVPMSDIA